MKTFYFRSAKFSSSPSFVSDASVRILFLLRGFELGQPLISVHHWSHDMKITKLIKIIVCACKSSRPSKQCTFYVKLHKTSFENFKTKIFPRWHNQEFEKNPRNNTNEKNPFKENTMNCIFFRRYAIQKRIKIKCGFYFRVN